MKTPRHLRVDNGTHQAAPHSSGGGGKEYATLYVAASDSHADAQGTADYVCDGVDDEFEIEAAILHIWEEFYIRDGTTDNIGRPFGPSGRIILAEGTYYIGHHGIHGAVNPQNFPSTTGLWPPVIVQGQGAGTILYRDSARFLEQYGFANILFLYVFAGWTGNEEVVFRDLVWDGGADDNYYCTVYAQDCCLWFDRCIFRNLYHQGFAGVEMGGPESARFTNCIFEGDRGDGYALYISVGSFNTFYPPGASCVTGCTISGSHPSGGIALDAADVSVVGNTIDANNGEIGIFMRSSTCIVEGNTVTNAGRVGISVQSSDHNTIANNVVSASGVGISVGSSYNIVDSNTVYNTLQEGIFVASSASDNVVHGNYVYGGSQLAHNTYSGIRIGLSPGGNFRNSVQGNTVRHGGGGARFKYGIEIASQSTDALVTNNDLKDSGATGSFFNAGTGTVTTAGNRL